MLALNVTIWLALLGQATAEDTVPKETVEATTEQKDREQKKKWEEFYKHEAES